MVSFINTNACRLVLPTASAFQRSVDEFIKNHRLKKVYAYLDDLTVTGETLEEPDRNLK